MLKNSVFAVALYFLIANWCLGAESLPAPETLPPGGVVVLSENWATQMLHRWKSSNTTGSIEPTATGLTLITKETSEHIYDLQATALNHEALKAGDIILIGFAARSIKAEGATGATRLRVTFNLASPPWTLGTKNELGLSQQWHRYNMPFKCPVDFASGTAQLSFTFGFTPQQVEIADVSVLKYNPQTPLSSLPKTKLYADDVPQNIVDREFTRIATMRKELTAIQDPSPAHGKVIYVSSNGNASNSGTADKPLATIPQALKIVAPGDTILVGAGEYYERDGVSIKKSGKPDAWIKIKAAPGTRPKIVTSNWSGFELSYGISYVEIDGFELSWVKDPLINAFGVGVAPMYATHHIRILNNIIHGYGTGGICSLDCDYVHIEGNTIFDNAKTSPYGGSGISLCRSFNSDEYPGYHNVVRRNICFDNENKVIVLVASGGTGHTLTDGNGIIIDVFKRSRKNPLKNHAEDRNGPLEPYRGRTLVENNLCFNNGGRGVHIFRSAKVDVINNTCYMNQSTPEINGGELTAIEATDVVIANNLAYSRAGKRVCSQDGSSGMVLWSHDLLFGEDALIHKNAILGSDPMFAAASLNAKPEGFHLQSNSPALEKGIGLIAPLDDLLGKSRQGGSTVDLGAFQK